MLFYISPFFTFPSWCCYHLNNRLVIFFRTHQYMALKLEIRYIQRSKCLKVMWNFSTSQTQQMQLSSSYTSMVWLSVLISSRLHSLPVITLLQLYPWTLFFMAFDSHQQYSWMDFGQHGLRTVAVLCTASVFFTTLCPATDDWDKTLSIN